MAKILIIGTPNDFHCQAVELGIRKFGSTSYTWMPADVPDFSRCSIEIDPSERRHKIVVNHQDEIILLSDFDVVWNRRRALPTAPSDASEFDVKVIEDESLLHCENIINLLSISKKIVNCPIRQRRADRKSVQLDAAIKVGFEVLPTLLSNDLDLIRNFHLLHAPIIAKAHRPHGWISGGSTFNGFTFEMPDPDKWNSWSIEACPMIFQKKVVRQEELRVISFGGKCFAAKTVGADGVLDSRLATMMGNFESLRAADVPSEIEDKCLKYMKELSIDFGAFDFIVDRAGNWIFLECNESGQFLYIEEFLPEVKLLDEFCRWLIGLAGDSVPGDAEQIGVKNIMTSSEAYEQKLTRRTHKFTTNHPVIRETSG